MEFKVNPNYAYKPSQVKLSQVYKDAQKPETLTE